MIIMITITIIIIFTELGRAGSDSRPTDHYWKTGMSSLVTYNMQDKFTHLLSHLQVLPSNTAYVVIHKRLNAWQWKQQSTSQTRESMSQTLTERVVYIGVHTREQGAFVRPPTPTHIMTGSRDTDLVSFYFSHTLSDYLFSAQQLFMQTNNSCMPHLVNTILMVQ